MTTTSTTSATTRCTHCGKRFRIDPNPSFLPCPPSEYEGRLKRCPACHKLFTVKLENRSTKPQRAALSADADRQCALGGRHLRRDEPKEEFAAICPRAGCTAHDDTAEPSLSG